MSIFMFSSRFDSECDICDNKKNEFKIHLK